MAALVYDLKCAQLTTRKRAALYAVVADEKEAMRFCSVDNQCAAVARERARRESSEYAVLLEPMREHTSAATNQLRFAVVAATTVPAGSELERAPRHFSIDNPLLRDIRP